MRSHPRCATSVSTYGKAMPRTRTLLCALSFGVAANVAGAQSPGAPMTRRSILNHLQPNAKVIVGANNRLFILDNVGNSVVARTSAGAVLWKRRIDVTPVGQAATRPFFGGMTGDSVWIWRAGGDSVTLISSKGASVRRLLRMPHSNTEGAFFIPRALVSDHVIAEEVAGIVAARRLAASHRLVVRATPGGEVRDTLAELRTSHSILQVEGPDGSLIFGLQPWSAGDMLGIAVDGRAATVIYQDTDNSVLHTSPESLHSRWFELTAGDSGRERRLLVTRKPVDEERVVHFASALSAAPFARPFGSDRAKAQRAIVEALYRPQLMAPASRVIVDDGGNAWIRRAEDESGERWTILSVRDDVTRDVRIPSGIRVEAIVGGSIWGSTQAMRGERRLVTIALVTLSAP